MSGVAKGVAAVALVVGVFLLALATMGGAVGAASADAQTTSMSAAKLLAGNACVTAGPVPQLDRSQAAMAAQVVAATFAASGEDLRAARIAVMAADTESGLRNLGPLPNNDGSLGLFQQRVAEGWGTAAQELDPRAATAMFIHHLLAIPGWRRLAPWVAAQQVQRSAFAGGGNYRQHWGAAGTILAGVLADGNARGSCGQGVPGGVAGPASAFGLPSGYSIPGGIGSAHARAVRFALAQLGKPYVWAAAGPKAFDCSGLTMAAWGAAGVHLLHYTVDQQHEGVPVSAGTLEAGDLVLVPGSDSPGPGLAGHVGIYLGYGLVESAVDPQVGVVVQTWKAFTGGGIDALVNPDPSDA